MTAILLTQKESDKFSAYLKMSAEGDKGILEQFKKLGSDTVNEKISKEYKAKMCAKLIVANILDSTEHCEIG